MYNIYNIIWGIPYTEKLKDATVKEIPDWAEDPDSCHDELEQYGFEFLYSGDAVYAPGYLGVLIEDGPSWELDIPTIKALEPTEAQQLEAQQLYDKLPQWVKDAAEPLCFHIVWSTS